VQFPKKASAPKRFEFLLQPSWGTEDFCLRHGQPKRMLFIVQNGGLVLSGLCNDVARGTEGEGLA
jgi:hypothetical protein